MTTRTALLSALVLSSALSATQTGHSIGMPAMNMGVDYTLASDPAHAPRVVGNNLVVTVQHASGCSLHTFTPHEVQKRMGVLVWMEHTVDKPEACFTLALRTVNIPISPAMRARHDVVIYGPHNTPVHVRVP